MWGLLILLLVGVFLMGPIGFFLALGARARTARADAEFREIRGEIRVLAKRLDAIDALLRQPKKDQPAAAPVDTPIAIRPASEATPSTPPATAPAASAGEAVIPSRIETSRARPSEPSPSELPARAPKVARPAPDLDRRGQPSLRPNRRFEANPRRLHRLPPRRADSGAFPHARRGAWHAVGGLGWRLRAGARGDPAGSLFDRARLFRPRLPDGARAGAGLRAGRRRRIPAPQGARRRNAGPVRRPGGGRLYPGRPDRGRHGGGVRQHLRRHALYGFIGPTSHSLRSARQASPACSPPRCTGRHWRGSGLSVRWRRRCWCPHSVRTPGRWCCIWRSLSPPPISCRASAAGSGSRWRAPRGPVFGVFCCDHWPAPGSFRRVSSRGAAARARPDGAGVLLPGDRPPPRRKRRRRGRGPARQRRSRRPRCCRAVHLAPGLSRGVVRRGLDIGRRRRRRDPWLHGRANRSRGSGERIARALSRSPR